jgi:hypothetical protein
VFLKASEGENGTFPSHRFRILIQIEKMRGDEDMDFSFRDSLLLEYINSVDPL